MGDEQRRGSERLLDVAVYAPLGFALEFRRMFPDLVERGRRQVMFTKTLGKTAVTRGGGELRRRLHNEPEVSAQGDQSSDVDSVTPEPIPAKPSPMSEERSATTSAPPDLAIADYDSLSAQHVVRRLDGLAPAELEAVRDYEEANRGRRTILSRIAQLQG